jgi:hypothetical protein
MELTWCTFLSAWKDCIASQSAPQVPLMTAAHRRTVRGIDADHQHSYRVVTRSCFAACNIIAYVAARAVFIGVNPFGGPINARLTGIGSAVAFVLFLVLLKMRSIHLAAAIAVWTFAFGVWNGVSLHHWIAVAYWCILSVCAGVCAWHLRLMEQFRREYAAAWTPYEIQGGDVFTVRDGDAFSVLKVLATEPGRIHVRQFGLRYPERPWTVKSTTLLRDSNQLGAQAYAHLPLDFQEFMRWEPSLLRSEPLSEEELRPLEVWRRQQVGEG